MKRTWKTWTTLMLCAVVLLTALGLPALGQEKGFEKGDELAGFSVKQTDRMALFGADVTLFEHQKTGALVMLLANGDTNRMFDISFRTPVVDDTGLPHVFEHSTLNGSEKYPSKSLFFNLIHQTYNTFMNAMTADIVTTYPVASLSEQQLLKYADFYTDSAFNPMLMVDESIFLKESWRYTMANKEDPLTISGTVYTEMQGSSNIQLAAHFNARRTAFPGSLAGNNYAGNPAHIPEMSWDDLKQYHDDYYHPSNALAVLYGKFEDVPAFLNMLDGYFSAFEKKEYAAQDAGYQALTAPVEAHYDFAVEAGSDTTRGAVVVLGFVLQEVTRQEDAALMLMPTLLNNASSPFQQAMKQRLPAATATCYYDIATPEPAMVFQASGLSAEEAPVFREIIESSLADIQEKGFDLAAVEAVAASDRMETLLKTESANVGADTVLDIAYYWAATGDTQAYSYYMDNTANYLPFAQAGLYQQVIAKHLAGNPRTALVVTAPMPGLKEQEVKALADELAAKKAAMSDEEITTLVEATAGYNAPEEEDDAAKYVASLQAVDVGTLPVERRIYDITDETGEDRVRRMFAQADVSGVGHSLLLLSAAALPQEDLHWYKLYTDLMGKLDTKAYDNAALSALMTRYLYKPEIRPTVYVGEKRDQCDPYLRVSWIAMDEDMPAAYDLVYELLYETRLDDARKIADLIGQVKNNLKQSITLGAYEFQMYRAMASASKGFEYHNYLSYLDYYAFLEEAEALFASDPDAALERLRGIQTHFHTRADAVSAFAGSAQSEAIHRQTADAFLNRLEETRREKAVYALPAIAAKEGIVLDASVQNNLLYAPFASLGMEKTTGVLDAVGRLVSDAFLYPQLRDQYGVYGVMTGGMMDGVLSITIHDPNVKETFDVFAALPQMIEDMPLDQETLNGYILSAYSGYAQSQGELSGALNALVNILDGLPQETMLEWMKELKTLTPEAVKAYAPMYKLMSENGYISTTGGAAVIEQHQDMYDVVLNPFAVKETSSDALSDVTEGAPYYEALQFVLDKKVMAPLSGEAFGASEPATLGDFISAFFGMAGVPVTAEQGVMALQQMDVLAAEDKAEDTMTREKLANVVSDFLAAAAGQDTKANLAPLDEVADRDQITPGNEESLQFMLGNGMMNLEDGKLMPQETVTRAQLAYVIWGLDKLE